MPLLMKLLLTVSVFVGLPVASYFAGKAFAPDPVASQRPDGPGLHRAVTARPAERETAATAGVAQPTTGSSAAPRRTHPRPKAHRTAGRVTTAAAPTPSTSASAAPAAAPTPAEAPSSSAPATSTDTPAPEPSQSPTPTGSSSPAPEGSATPSPAA